MTSSITKLREAVEAGVVGGDMPRASSFSAMTDDPNCLGWARQAYNGSLDAAKALDEALLPEMPIRLIDHGAEFEDVGRWNAKLNWQHMTWQPRFTALGPFGYEGQCNSPARAWLVAILKALEAQEADDAKNEG